MISSLFLIPFEANVGYAISAYESLFYETGMEIGNGEPQRVHFGYANFAGGPPKFLPKNFKNLIEFDPATKDPRHINRLADYVKRNNIQIVVGVDVRPLHPLFRPLREAGAVTILAYWGASISSRMPAWKLILKRLQILLSRSKVDGLIFESRAMADGAIYGRGIPAEMIDIVPLGVNTNLFRPAHSDYSYALLSLPRERKIIVYAGHMERRKGVHVLIEAAIEILIKRRRKDVCFLICGNLDNQSREFEAMYAGLGIDELIRFVGYRADLAKIYQSCFCGVIPSTGWDSFTCASLEMASTGLPVVASRLDGLPEATLDRETGLLFEPGNARELADCLEVFLNHPELAVEYGRRGRIRCEREFNLQVHRQNFINVLRKRLPRSHRI